jgi:hypothetical protein
MASGSYVSRESVPLKLIETIETQSRIPARTRKLQVVEPEAKSAEGEEKADAEASEVEIARSASDRATQSIQLRRTTDSKPLAADTQVLRATVSRPLVIDAQVPSPLQRHRTWLNPLVISLVCVIVGAGILTAAAVMQRPGQASVVSFVGGQVYSVQVGGSLAGTWQSNQPLPPKVPIAPHAGPYSVVGKPTITAAFINKVLTAYNSPAAGKGQALYDLGVQYGIDPVFALAFFMHESSFGTMGEARSSLSLGNLRCIPNFECRDGYAWFPTWEAGFKAWYALIRNLYVADWGLTTVEQIIPRYAPPSDNNNDSAYISAVEHAIDTWRAGYIYP